jgi:hypothetical protein
LLAQVVDNHHTGFKSKFPDHTPSFSSGVADIIYREWSQYPHAMALDALKGQTYQITFDGNDGTSGVIPLFLALTPPALNDKFKNRIKLARHQHRSGRFQCRRDARNNRAHC